MKLMETLNATECKMPAQGGPDISVWTSRGFPSATLLNKNDEYFLFQHSDGDSMLALDPVSLDKNTALFAAVSYVIADLSVDLPKTITD